MLNLKKLTLLLINLFFVIAAMAQNVAVTIADKNDVMRTNGKIYVVMTIVMTILAGLFFYVYRLDKKISKLEKEEA